MTLKETYEQKRNLQSSMESLITEQQTTIRELQKSNREQGQQILNLSSENCVLKSELQKMAEQIVKLNEADLIVKQNEELRNENSSLKQQASEEQRKARAAETTAKEKELRADERERKARELIRENTDRQEKLDKEVREKVDAGIKREIRSIERRLEAPTAFLFFYSVATTILTGIRSEAFLGELGAFWDGLKAVGWFFCQLLWVFSDSIAGSNTVALWALRIVFVLVALFAAGIALTKYGEPVWKEYKFYCDGTTLAAFVITLVAAVWFADFLAIMVPINLVLLVILAHFGFVFLRWGLDKK